MENNTTRRTYLGDGLYADYDGYQFHLFSHDGVEILNQVFLDDRVLGAFLSYIDYVRPKTRTKPELETRTEYRTKKGG